MKSFIVTLAIAAGLTAPFVAQANDTTNLSTTAQSAMQAALGERAKDLNVTVSQGVARIEGWALQPHDVDVARLVVSKVPGVTQAYSAGARTWMATDRL